MAQVYSFVDENGATRLFAEIQPDPAGTPFNGGTIDNALVVDVDTGSNVTAIQAEANGVKINALADGGARATLQADASAPMLDLNAANVGDDLIDCSDGTARRFRVGSGGALLSSPANGADDSVFKAGDGSTALIVNNGGAVIIAKHAAPADGELAAGQLAFWFDQTNGAAKFMLKGKTANGTVVAASVAMA